MQTIVLLIGAGLSVALVLAVRKMRLERKKLTLSGILGILVMGSCLVLVIWALVADALSSQNPKTLLPTAGPLCAAAFSGHEVGAEPTLSPPGAPVPTATATVQPLEPTLSLIYVSYEDAEWELAKLLGSDEPRSADDVRSLLCVWQDRGGRGYSDGYMGYSIVWRARLIDWPSGRLLATERFVGGDPPSSKTGPGDRYGSNPSKFELQRWVSSVFRPWP